MLWLAGVCYACPLHVQKNGEEVPGAPHLSRAAQESCGGAVLSDRKEPQPGPASPQPCQPGPVHLFKAQFSQQ